MSLFTQAKPAAAAKPKTKKAKTEAVEIEGLETYAGVCAVLKALEAVKTTMEADIKEFGVAKMVTAGMDAGKRPENLAAVEGKATASIQLRVKGANIAIPIEDAARLRMASVPLTEVDVVTDTFIINPEYAQDGALLEKVSKALEGVKGLPADFIQKQEEKRTVVDGDTTMNAIFAIKDRSLVEALLPLVCSTAIRPSFKGKIEDAVKAIADLLEDA